MNRLAVRARRLEHDLLAADVARLHRLLSARGVDAALDDARANLCDAILACGGSAEEDTTFADLYAHSAPELAEDLARSVWALLRVLALRLYNDASTRAQERAGRVLHRYNILHPE